MSPSSLPLYGQAHGVRVTMVEALKKEFPDMGLSYVIGTLSLTSSVLVTLGEE